MMLLKTQTQLRLLHAASCLRELKALKHPDAPRAAHNRVSKCVGAALE